MLLFFIVVSLFLSSSYRYEYVPSVLQCVMHTDQCDRVDVCTERFRVLFGEDAFMGDNSTTLLSLFRPAFD